MQQCDIITINKWPIVGVTCVWEANLDDPRNGLGREHDPGAALSAFLGHVQLGEGRGDKKGRDQMQRIYSNSNESICSKRALESI